MRENREFYSCNVRYVLSFYVCYILVFGCEIKEKRNRAFFNYINYLVLLVIADGLSFKVFVSQSYVFIYNRIKLICGKICLINER